MTSVSVGGVTFGNPGVLDVNGVRWAFSGISGWFDGAPTKGAKTDRPLGHGSFAERVWRDGRPIVVNGFADAPSRRLASDAQKTLASVLADGNLGPFVVDDEDQGVLSAEVHIEGAPLIDWNSGTVVEFQLSFYAPDPLRYGTPATETTPFPSPAGGLHYPLYTNRSIRTGSLSYGARSSSGRLTITNPGNADMWPQWQAAGPVDAAGFEIIRTDTGDRLRFEGGVALGSTLVMDSATGVVVIDGTADRSGLLTWRDWSPITPGGTAEYSFVNLGTLSAAQLTATTTPGWW